MLSIVEARRLVLERCKTLERTEACPVVDAVGRVLAADVHADGDLPPFDRVTMDGYAVHAADTGADTRLPVDGEVAAGATGDEPLPAGRARAIMTGAPLPPGADAVIQVEWTRAEAGGIHLERGVVAGQNVAPRGEDLTRGQVVARAGERVTALSLSLLIASGVAEVSVVARPRVALLTSGDELVPPGQPLRRGQIRESNGPALAALLADAGAEIVDRAVARDTREDLAAHLDRALEADVVVLTGGSSVGRYDFSAEVVGATGAELHFDRLAVKPGKPTLFHTLGERAIFCLPGNPVAALMTGRVLVSGALRRLAGEHPAAWTEQVAPLLDPVQRNPARDLLVPLRRTPEGLAFDGWHGSGDLVCMARADAFGFIGRGEGRAPAGTPCPWFAVRPPVAG